MTMVHLHFELPPFPATLVELLTQNILKQALS